MFKKSEKENSFTRLWQQLRSYISLNIENAKLTVAEKFTILVTAAAVSIVALMLAVIILFFATMGLAQLLGEAVGMMWAYLIMAGAYLGLLIAIILLRNVLITNPVSRFITRLFFLK